MSKTYWAIVKRGRVTRDFRGDPAVYGKHKEANWGCDKHAGERVIKVRIVPVEEET